MAPFKTSLYTHKRVFTAWGMYMTLVSFNGFPSCNFMFTDIFSSHFIFWPFSTMTLISNFLTSVVSFFLYVEFDDSPLSPNDYLMSSSLFSYLTYPQNVAPIKRFPTSFSFSFPFFAQQSIDLWPIFPLLLHSPLKEVFILQTYHSHQ